MTLHQDWSAPNAMAEWQADCDRERAITAATGKSALERACEEVAASARSVVISAVEMRARRFRSNFTYFVGQLEIIAPGLSMKTWPRTVDYLTARIDSAAEQRWQGFGGETARINMTAALVVAREMVANETFTEAAE